MRCPYFPDARHAFTEGHAWNGVGVGAKHRTPRCQAGVRHTEDSVRDWPRVGLVRALSRGARNMQKGVLYISCYWSDQQYLISCTSRLSKSEQYQQDHFSCSFLLCIYWCALQFAFPTAWPSMWRGTHLDLIDQALCSPCRCGHACARLTSVV